MRLVNTPFSFYFIFYVIFRWQRKNLCPRQQCGSKWTGLFWEEEWQSVGRAVPRTSLPLQVCCCSTCGVLLVRLNTEFNIYSKNRNPPFTHCICWVSEKIFWPETSNIYLTFPLVLLGGELMLGPHAQPLAVVEPRLELCAAWRVPRAGQKR